MVKTIRWSRRSPCRCAKRQVITGSLAEEVDPAAVENVGPKGRIDEWLTAVVEEAGAARPRRERALRRQDQGAGSGLERQGGHRTGCSTTPVGSLPGYGLPVVNELLELVRGQIRTACDDLEQERIEFESFFLPMSAPTCRQPSASSAASSAPSTRR